MEARHFTTFCIGLLLLIQTVAGQQPATAPAATNSVTTVLKVVPPDPEQLTIDLDDGVKMEFVLIPAGEFLMGSFKNNPPVHNVKLTKPFYIGKYEVTQDQWLAVMHENRSKFNNPKRPVENVSWEDCQKFLMLLNAKATGQTFSLPTEAQWEYACRAGNDDSPDTDDADLETSGWYLKNAAHMTHPVGELKPNAWGVYDMQGNVWEWCADWFGAYEGGDETDPTGPETGWMRVLRGGAWCNYATSCRCSNRGFYPPTTRNQFCGFRVVVDIH